MYSENRRTPKELVLMVEKINQVGVGQVKNYVMSKHPRTDWDRCIKIIRFAAKYGYSACVTEFSISKQRAEQILKRFYQYACEIEQKM